MLVPDITIAGAWLQPLEDATARRVYDEAARLMVTEPPRVPFVFHIELAELVRGRLGAGQASLAQVEELFQLVAELGIETDRVADRLCREVLHWAEQYSLSIIEASYLDTAMRSGGTLATLRPGLAAAARQAGLPLLAPSEGHSQ